VFRAAIRHNSPLESLKGWDSTLLGWKKGKKHETGVISDGSYVDKGCTKFCVPRSVLYFRFVKEKYK